MTDKSINSSIVLGHREKKRKKEKKEKKIFCVRLIVTDLILKFIFTSTKLTVTSAAHACHQVS